MKTVTIFLKQSQNTHKITASDWNDFVAKLFQVCPISYIEEVEDMEYIFNNGFENASVKIN